MSDANGPVETPTTAQEEIVPAKNGGSEAWWAGLQNGDNRSLAEKKQWKTADDAMASFRELETAFSKSIRPLKPDATAEEEAAFYARLGRPEKPEGYELKLDPATVPEDFPYDADSAAKFRTWAFSAGVNPRQAQSLHDAFVADQAAHFKAAKEAQERQEADAHRTIVRNWGEPDSQQYKENLTLAGRAIHGLGLKDALVAGGLISADGAIRNHVVADAMLKVGKELYSEGSANNPGTVPVSQSSDVASRMYGATTPPNRG